MRKCWRAAVNLSGFAVLLVTAAGPALGQVDPDAAEAVQQAYKLAQAAEKQLPDESGYDNALDEFAAAEALAEGEPAVLAELLRIRATLHSTFGYVEDALADLERIDQRSASARTRSYAELLQCKLLARQGRTEGLADRLRRLRGTGASGEADALATALPDIEASWELARKAREALVERADSQAKAFSADALRKWPENPLALALSAASAEDEPAWIKASTRARLVNRNLREVLLVLCTGYQSDMQSTIVACLKEPAPGLEPLKDSLVLDLGGGVTMELVKIPAGEFMMGSDEIISRNAAPQHKVRITRSFYIGRTEVTQLQWTAVMGSNPSESERQRHPDLPVEWVSWLDCQAFCRKLSRRVGKEVRLPTEAEWEYACRAGTTTAFSFGDSPDALGDYAWYWANSSAQTHPVGQKRPNAWGLYDMHGNVTEWCSDWHADDYYASSPLRDPQGPPSGTRRVLRGGSWLVNAYICQSAIRGRAGPDSHGIGFRCSVGTP